MLVLAVTAGMLGASLALRVPCFDPATWHGAGEYESLCYSDVQVLYGARDLERLPYVDGALREGRLVGGALEYPVLTGLVMWLGARFSSDPTGYVLVTAALLALPALATAWALAGACGRRALLWAAAPALGLYALHNWDLLAVAAATAGLLAWRRGSGAAAGALFGLGAAAKLYPAVLLLPLALERWRSGERRSAVAAAAAAGIAFAALNLPFAVADFDGWSATYAFHAQRTPNVDSIWSQLPSPLSPGPAAAGAAGAALTAGAIAAVLAVAARRRGDGGFGPWLGASAAVLAVVLALAKVQSPQFALWLLPFFVLLRVPLRWWVAYGVLTAALHIAVFEWFAGAAASGSPSTDTPAGAAMTAGVWLRAGFLLVLAGVFLRAPECERDPGGPGRRPLS